MILGYAFTPQSLIATPHTGLCSPKLVRGGSQLRSKNIKNGREAVKTPYSKDLLATKNPDPEMTCPLSHEKRAGPEASRCFWRKSATPLLDPASVRPRLLLRLRPCRTRGRSRSAATGRVTFAAPAGCAHQIHLADADNNVWPVGVAGGTRSRQSSSLGGNEQGSDGAILALSTAAPAAVLEHSLGAVFCVRRLPPHGPGQRLRARRATRTSPRHAASQRWRRWRLRQCFFVCVMRVAARSGSVCWVPALCLRACCWPCASWCACAHARPSSALR